MTKDINFWFETDLTLRRTKLSLEISRYRSSNFRCMAYSVALSPAILVLWRCSHEYYGREKFKRSGGSSQGEVEETVRCVFVWIDR